MQEELLQYAKLVFNLQLHLQMPHFLTELCAIAMKIITHYCILACLLCARYCSRCFHPSSCNPHNLDRPYQHFADGEPEVLSERLNHLLRSRDLTPGWADTKSLIPPYLSMLPLLHGAKITF